MKEHPVLVCYRGLDSADGVQLGAQLAGALGEPLVLATAYRYEPVGLSARALPSPENERRAATAQRTLQRARRFAGTDIEIREEAVPATGIAGALVALARDVDAGLLVVGRDTTGHVTRALVARSPCPLAVAPLSVPLPRTGPIERIGVAYDGTPGARLALIAATQLALATRSVLVLLAAGPTPEHAAAALHVARLSVTDAVSLDSCELVGKAPTALAGASRDLDLLVCGSRGRGRARAAVLGSVSAYLVDHAECPVLVVPPVWGSDSPLGIARAASNV